MINLLTWSSLAQHYALVLHVSASEFAFLGTDLRHRDSSTELRVCKGELTCFDRLMEGVNLPAIGRLRSGMLSV